jgi:hypothetical protein
VTLTASRAAGSGEATVIGTGGEVVAVDPLVRGRRPEARSRPATSTSSSARCPGARSEPPSGPTASADTPGGSPRSTAPPGRVGGGRVRPRAPAGGSCRSALRGTQAGRPQRDLGRPPAWTGTASPGLRVSPSSDRGLMLNLHRTVAFRQH